MNACIILLQNHSFYMTIYVDKIIVSFNVKDRYEKEYNWMI